MTLQSRQSKQQMKVPLNPPGASLAKRDTHDQDLQYRPVKFRFQNVRSDTRQKPQFPAKQQLQALTISTNFEVMGKLLAQMILKGKKEQIENKSALIIRNSL